MKTTAAMLEPVTVTKSLGLELSDYDGLSRWQRCELALEVLNSINPTDADERHLVDRARHACIDLRHHYD